MNPNDKNRIYTIKVLDVFLEKKIEDASTLARGSLKPPAQPPCILIL